MKKLSKLDWIALILLVIGGLNWGLVGIFNLDVVKTLFGHMTFLSRTIYFAVGLSAIYVLVISFKLMKNNSLQE
jgi:uncharacterized membrane protein YuzA (DUF378 family)